MPIRPARRTAARPLAACAALTLVLLLGGCELVDRAAQRFEDEPTAAASHEPPTPGPAEAAGDAPERPVSTLTTGGATLELTAPRAAVVEGDGPRAVTLDLAPGDTADLTLTSAGALDVDSDGSVTVLDGDGTPVAALGPPAPPPDAGSTAPRIEVTDVDATHARLEVDDRLRPGQGTGAAESGSAGPVRYTVTAGDRAIESATWGENEGGRSLAVDPADWARRAGEAGLDLIRTQLVAAEPEADSATMDNQLVCHAVGAIDKPTWNLEPWRPDVGLILTATAHCNPVRRDDP
ncbi:DUF2599 domain-containing protein [Promicromonospora sp. NPDC050880]|uniref:DUF2599 domain-containing protein n=1 Tax=Promicromonospora sp. NPDC050880 TaxID=3364406 RepID=UPI0037AD8E9E